MASSYKRTTTMPPLSKEEQQPGEPMMIGQHVAELMQSLVPVKRMKQHACSFALYSHDTRCQIPPKSSNPTRRPRNPTAPTAPAPIRNREDHNRRPSRASSLPLPLRALCWRRPGWSRESFEDSLELMMAMMYKAVASLCRIGDQMREQDVVDYFIPMRKCPGGVENRTGRNIQSAMSR
ncbi:hypothetical protein NL676_008517 [Syzygium grande]|nr:hypothetical protein NL676_008517 [Syzygium grande]